MIDLSSWGAVFFWVFAAVVLGAALLVVFARSAVHSALFLISALFSVAALFVMLQAEFVAGAQVLIYIGGVMVLFIFVVMLVNVRSGALGEAFNRPSQVATSIVFCALLGLALVYAINTGVPELEKEGGRNGQRITAQENSSTKSTGASQDTQRFAAGLYGYAALPFEIASLLLLVAIIGSVMLARTKKQELATGDYVSSDYDEDSLDEQELKTVVSSPSA